MVRFVIFLLLSIQIWNGGAEAQNPAVDHLILQYLADLEPQPGDHIASTGALIDPSCLKPESGFSPEVWSHLLERVDTQIRSCADYHNIPPFKSVADFLRNFTLVCPAPQLPVRRKIGGDIHKFEFNETESGAYASYSMWWSWYDWSDDQKYAVINMRRGPDSLGGIPEYYVSRRATIVSMLFHEALHYMSRQGHDEENLQMGMATNRDPVYAAAELCFHIPIRHEPLKMEPCMKNLEKLFKEDVGFLGPLTDLQIEYACEKAADQPFPFSQWLLFP